MSKLQILREFQDCFKNFFDDLIRLFDGLEEAADLVIARIFVIDQTPIDKIMNYFIQKILPLKQQVKDRDVNFFLKNNILFEEVDKNKVNRFKTLVQSNNVDDEDIKIFFRWFESFIYIAEKYKKLLDN